MVQVNTLKPGLLVSLKTGTNGNVSYTRSDVEPEQTLPDGAKRAKWETERLITDPDEYENAHAVRSKCRGAIYKVCTASTFGLLCPEDKKDELDEAIKYATETAAEFNRTAALTRVHVYVIVGRIAADDVEAVRAINSEVRGLLEDMQKGLKNLDVKAVREAARKAKSVGQMLAPAAAERIKEAVEAARSAAKKIVAAGDDVAMAIDRNAIKKINASRTAFLDLEEEPAVEAAPVVRPKIEMELDPNITAGGDVAMVGAKTTTRKKQPTPQLEV